MINSVANFDTSVLIKPVREFNLVDAKNQLEKIQKRDGLKISSLGVTSTKIDLKDVQNTPLLIQIEKDFKADFYSGDRTDITLYDISSCSEDFPFKLTSNQILGFKLTPQIQAFDLSIESKIPHDPHRIQIQIFEGDESIMSPGIFEQTVLKAILKVSDHVKNQLESSPSNTSYDFCIGIGYDNSSRAVDWDNLDKSIEHLLDFEYDDINTDSMKKTMKDEMLDEVLDIKSEKDDCKN